MFDAFGERSVLPLLAQIHRFTTLPQTQKAPSCDEALIAMAGSTGLEPATSDVTGRRSNQTELTPQADVRVCFRSRALRGLVYTEVCPARNNFFEKFFGAIREGFRG